MDPATKQQLLEELQKEYNVILKPKTEPKFEVKSTIDNYLDQIYNKCDISEGQLSVKDSITMAIRRVVCLRYGVLNIQDVPKNQRKFFKTDIEWLIKHYILKLY